LVLMLVQALVWSSPWGSTAQRVGTHVAAA